jgi:hypothetical protein
MERARAQLIHLPGLHPAGGVFLQNASRFYFDCGLHPEICTPECTSPLDAVRYIEAGHRILGRLAAEVESAGAPGTEIMCFRCNVDYSGSQSTWGCHESYLHRIPQEELQPQIVPHLVSRLIYAGAGGFNPLSRGLEFTLSPRMAYFRRVITESSTSERGIWHAKSESLSAGYSRLHVLCGESLCSETATFLKIGATALIVAMADAGLAPGSAVQLADSLEALHHVAGDVTCRKPLRMADASYLTAVAIQRHYLEMAEAHVGDSFMPEWVAQVCHCWRAVLDQLENAPGAVAQTLDWGIKLALYANHARSLGIRWDELPFLNQVIDQVVAALDGREGRRKAVPLERAIGSKRTMPKVVAALEPLLQSRGLEWDDLRTVLNNRLKFLEIDTRFGQLGPKGIFETLDLADALNHRVSGVDNIEQAMTEPPPSGRARIRGQVIQRLAGAGHAQCDWQSIVDRQQAQVLDLSDPFTSEESWRPLGRAEVRDVGGYPGGGEERDPFSRRQDAADRILSGDYAGAETLLRGLLEERFILPSTHCHLARVLLMTDREAEAWEQINFAWAIREEASAYVVPRILFFQCVFSMLDGAGIDTLVGQIRVALRAPCPHMDWTIRPMLDHLRSRLGETNYNFLKALAAALSDAEGMTHLDDFPQWRGEAITSEVTA